jgi:hypothetical protein
MNLSKTTGYVLIAFGLLLALAITAWGFSYFSGSSTAIFVLIFALLLGGPLVGIGVYALTKGSGEAAEEKVIAKQRKLLNLVQTQGKVSLAVAAIELNVSRDEIKQLVYDLVGKQLFSGFIDWDKQELHSVELSKIKNGSCPKCGGELEVAGKGLVKCPFCGSEVFSN